MQKPVAECETIARTTTEKNLASGPIDLNEIYSDKPARKIFLSDDERYLYDFNTWSIMPQGEETAPGIYNNGYKIKEDNGQYKDRLQRVARRIAQIINESGPKSLAGFAIQGYPADAALRQEFITTVQKETRVDAWAPYIAFNPSEKYGVLTLINTQVTDKSPTKPRHLNRLPHTFLYTNLNILNKKNNKETKSVRFINAQFSPTATHEQINQEIQTLSNDKTAPEQVIFAADFGTHITGSLGDAEHYIGKDSDNKDMTVGFYFKQSPVTTPPSRPIPTSSAPTTPTTASPEKTGASTTPNADTSSPSNLKTTPTPSLPTTAVGAKSAPLSDSTTAAKTPTSAPTPGGTATNKASTGATPTPSSPDPNKATTALAPTHPFTSKIKWGELRDKFAVNGYVLRKISDHRAIIEKTSNKESVEIIKTSEDRITFIANTSSAENLTKLLEVTSSCLPNKDSLLTITITGGTPPLTTEESNKIKNEVWRKAKEAGLKVDYLPPEDYINSLPDNFKNKYLAPPMISSGPKP